MTGGETVMSCGHGAAACVVEMFVHPGLYAAFLLVLKVLKWFSGGGFVWIFDLCGTALLHLG